jgi:hypothetical protein
MTFKGDLDFESPQIIVKMKFYAKFEEKSSIGKGFKERAQNA